jgi:hypothetical protein
MKIRLCFLSAMSTALLAASASAEVLYGISKGFGSALSQVYEMDPLTAQISNAVVVTLPGFTVSHSLALAANPLDNTLWAVIQTSDNVRRLVTIVPSTGVATQVGPLANQISTLAFRADGTLLGVSGDGGSPPETLYQISTTNGNLTLLFALGNGADGETIAMHPSGLVYHSSGNNSALFESIDLGTQLVTPLGSAAGEAFAMGYSAASGQMFLSDINLNLYTVNLANGARTLIGFINSVSDNRGLAFVGPPPITAYCDAGLAGVISCPCSNPPSSTGRGCDNSSATGGASVSGSGSASLGADTLVFTTLDEKPTATSIVLQGTTADATGVVFGQGVRCVSGTLKRLYVKSAIGGSITAPAGSDPTVSARSLALGDTINATEHRYYMVYYRDPVVLGGCPALSTFNATNALDVIWGL